MLRCGLPAQPDAKAAWVALSMKAARVTGYFEQLTVWPNPIVGWASGANVDVGRHVGRLVVPVRNRRGLGGLGWAGLPVPSKMSIPVPLLGPGMGVAT